MPTQKELYDYLKSSKVELKEDTINETTAARFNSLLHFTNSTAVNGKTVITKLYGGYTRETLKAKYYDLLKDMFDLHKAGHLWFWRFGYHFVIILNELEDF